MHLGVSWVPLGVLAVFGWLLAAVVYSWLAKNKKSLGKTPKNNKTPKTKVWHTMTHGVGGGGVVFQICFFGFIGLFGFA